MAEQKIDEKSPNSQKENQTEQQTEHAKLKKEEIKKDDLKKLKAQVEELTTTLKETESKLSAEHENLLRLAAEYDNFRRRTNAQRELTYSEAYKDFLIGLLPTFDNIERASKYDELSALKEGLEMTISGLLSALKSFEIEEIENTTFDPNLHNAVMHIEDEKYGIGQIVEVLQKGYKRGDHVIRYSMVVVAN